MKVTYFGQSCFLLDTGDKKLLFDPFITPNELAADVDIDSIEADYILVSHGHADHTADLVYLAKKTKAVVISNFEIITWLEKQGIANGHSMNLGGKWDFDFGRVKMVFAAHSSSMPDGTYGGTAAGFILTIHDRIIYYAGDTALTQEMKLIGELYPPDTAFLPVGDNYTMGIDDAIMAAKFIRCGEIIGMHYDTFGYIKIDKEEAQRKFKDSALNLKLPGIGETISF